MIRASLLTLLLIFFAADVKLLPVPEPPVESMQPAVREQLASARDAVELAPDRASRAEAFERLGRLHLLYEFPEAAAPALRNASALEPSAWKAMYLVGVIDQQAGRFDAALEAFGAVLEQRASDVPTWLRRGEILLRQRQLEAARAAFERSLELKPFSSSAHYGLARVASAEKRLGEAAASFERALELQPHADAVYHPLARVRRRQGDLEAARRLLEKAGDSRPIVEDPVMAELIELSVMARTFLLQGDRAQRRGLHDAALRFYRRALELDPRDAGVHYNLGTLFGELGRLREAERHFRAAIESDPSRADAYFNLAVGLRARGQLDAAADAFVEAARLAPNDAETRIEAGATLWALDRREEARAQLGAAVELDRDAELTLRFVRYLRSIEDSAAARPVVEAAVERWPAHLGLRLEGARQLAGQGRHAEAIGGLEPWLEEPLEDSPELFLVSARLLATAPEPVRDGDRALALAVRLPDVPEKTEILAMAHAAAGRFDEAIRLQTGLLAEAAAAGADAQVMRRLEENFRRYRQGLAAAWPPG